MEGIELASQTGMSPDDRPTEFKAVLDSNDPFLPSLESKEPREQRMSKLQVRLSKEETRPISNDPLEASETSPHLMQLAALQQFLQIQLDLAEPRHSPGLSTAEAELRLARDGPNILSPPKETSVVLRYLRQYTDPFMLLLLAAGVLTCIAYALDTTVPMNWYLGAVLFGVVILSCTFAFIQEGRATSVMKSFKTMLPQSAHVFRDGSWVDLPAANLVVGDLVRISTGDKVPADLRLIFVQDLKTETSALTGEALPVSMTTVSDEPEIEKARNVAFNTSQCMEGEGIGVVIAVGDNTVIGKIAGLVKQTKETDTTLQKEIKFFVRYLSIFALILGSIFVTIAMIRDPKHWISNLINSFIVVMIANVPEGLPMTVVTALTITARRMSEKQVFVKQLQSVETMGSATCIASDKTGTLTQNKMSVSRVWVDLQLRRCAEMGVPSALSPAPRTEIQTLVKLQLVAGCCNRSRYADQREISQEQASVLDANEVLNSIQGGNSVLTFHSATKILPIPVDPTLTIRSALAKYFIGSDDHGRVVLGDASDTALFNFIRKSTNIELLRYHFPIIFEVPFNSREKFALTIVKPFQHVVDHNPNRLLLIKGAPEVVLSKCSHFMMRGKALPIDDDFKLEFQSAYETCGGDGERVLGFAYLELNSDQYGPEFDSEYSTEKKNYPQLGYTFLGLISLVDPPKETVPAAIKTCKKAGIKVLMVTGDHPLTAAAIARQVNILTPGRTRQELEEANPSRKISEAEVESVVVTGAELSRFTEQDWSRTLSKNEVVFARTTPQQKLQIVEHLQAAGEIVCVTGDGVNDSPALKKADIGLAMGKAGSDVARDAAAVILMDDDFASVVTGIREGRTIFDNLTKTIAYTMTHIIPEVIPVLFNVAFGLPAGLVSLQILFIDLGTELAPAISFAYEPAEGDVMLRRPRNAKKDRLVSPRIAAYFLVAGILETFVSYTGFFLVFSYYGVAPKQLFFTASKYFQLNAPIFYANGLAFTAEQQMLMVGQAQLAYWVLLVLGQACHIWFLKTRTTSLWSHGLANNPVMIFGVVVEALLCLLLALVPPIRLVVHGILWQGAPFDSRIWALPLLIFGLHFLSNEPRKYAANKYGWRWLLC